MKWPRLPHGDRKLTHVSVDFDRWGDEEEGPGYGEWGGGRGGREHLPYPLLQTHHTNYSPDPVFSNWPTNTNPKTTTYVNPILTESDSNESESLSSEEEEGGWEDYLDVGFGD